MNRSAIVLLATLSGCTGGNSPAPEAPQASKDCLNFPRWTYDPSHDWPVDRSLQRPEDGKALRDGRILVADEAYGLRVIEIDGSSRPFGGFAENGYEHNPPEFPGGANAILVENGGRQVLVVDVYTGRIYRVDIETEATSVVYHHPYGINSIDQDSRGRLWFTQSTENTPEQGVVGLFRDINLPVPTGAVFRLDVSDDGYASTAEKVIGEVYFANGIAIDNAEAYLYVAEMMMDRVLRYRLDVAAGTVTGREVYQSVLAPDNIAFDQESNLWIASPLANEVIVVNPVCRSAHTVFQAPSGSNAAVSEAWVTRSHLGEPRLDLVAPDAWSPLPGFLTGMFWSNDGATIYFTGLGTAIQKYEIP